MTDDALFFSSQLGIITGLAAETRLAERMSKTVFCTGGRPDMAAFYAERLIASGSTGLMSFGIAGGLQPGLTPGTLIVADEIVTDDGRYPAMSNCAKAARARTGIIYGGTEIVATAAEKAALAARTGALAVDLESGEIARVAAAAGIPFIALRAIADPAERNLPPAALLPLTPKGQPRIMSVLWSILKRPGQISDLMDVARDTKTALEGLRKARRRLAR